MADVLKEISGALGSFFSQMTEMIRQNSGLQILIGVVLLLVGFMYLRKIMGGFFWVVIAIALVFIAKGIIDVATVESAVKTTAGSLGQASLSVGDAIANFFSGLSGSPPEPVPPESQAIVSSLLNGTPIGG